jgi:hypothetical protein
LSEGSLSLTCTLAVSVAALITEYREPKEADARREAFITMKRELDRRVFWSADTMSIPFNQINADVRETRISEGTPQEAIPRSQ